MEIHINGKKVAFTQSIPKDFYANLGDIRVFEENQMLGGEPFRHTANFITEMDARAYLEAKYSVRIIL